MIFRFGRLKRIVRFSPPPPKLFRGICFSPFLAKGSPFRLTAIGINLLAAHSVEVKSELHRRTELAGCKELDLLKFSLSIFIWRNTSTVFLFFCSLFLSSIVFSRSLCVLLEVKYEAWAAYFRYSTVAEAKHELPSAIDVLSFVQSSLHKPKGSLHYCLNGVSDCKNLFKEDGILLVVSDYVGNGFFSNPNTFKMFENVKSLHRRSISFNDISTSLIQSFFKEYINFPILLSKKNSLENHAIRRADLERRFVETIFPATADDKKYKSFWKWNLDKVWPGKLKSEVFNSESFLFPWHMLKASDSDLIILDQSFGTLWVINLESNSIREAVKESSKISEICGQMMVDKSISMRHVPSDWAGQQLAATYSFDGIPYPGLMSSIATFQDHIVFCDTVGRTVVKFDRGTGSAINFPFSNFGVLGLPYWFVPPLQQVFSNEGVPGLELDHVQEFNLFPGRVDIELYITVPQQTELVEQPQEGCIWCLARGAAAEVSGVKNKPASKEKVGIAQQWYDELYNLCYSTPVEEELSTKEESKPFVQGVTCIGCTINTSPGTSEAIILASLYLRLKKSTISREIVKVAKIVENMDPSKRFKRNLLVKVLTASTSDLEELMFLRHLHATLKIDFFDHPEADNLRNMIVSESWVKVEVTLQEIVSLRAYLK